jgi:tetratricopeptide (TPR) repeat protein
MLGKPIALWSLGGLLLAQVSLTGGIKTTDFRPPDLSSSQLSGSTGSEDFLKAKALAEKGEFQKALPLLERVHKKSPTDLQTLFWLGYTRENLRDTLGAIEAYQAFLKQSPQPEVFFRLGLLQLGRGDLSEATLSLQKAAEERPTWTDAQLLCAYALYTSGKPQQALPYAQKAATLDSSSEFAPLLLGEIYFAVDSFSQARAAYEEALRRNPASASAHLGIGKSLLALLQPQEALPHLQKAAENLPQDLQAHYYLGLAYKGLNQIPEAKAAFEKALTIDPTHARSHYEIALLYIQEKKPAQAEPHYQALQKYNPKLAARLAPLLGK